MQFIQNSQHKAQRSIDEIIFRPTETEIICDDGERYGVGTVNCDRPPKPLTLDVHIEMYFAGLHSVEYNTHLN